MDEKSSFPYEIPEEYNYSSYVIPIVNDGEPRDQPGYYHPEHLINPFPASTAATGVASEGASLTGTPNALVQSTEPWPMVPMGPQVAFTTTHDRILPDHGRNQPGAAQQFDVFKMESPNLSIGSSTTPETLSSGPLVTPEDHPQHRTQQSQPSTKRKKLGGSSSSRNSSNAAPTFRQYTVPPPRKKQQRTAAARQQQRKQQQQQQSPEEIAAEAAAAALELEELRKSRNRVAANKCRQKKKESAAKLEERSVTLQRRNARLEAELQALKAEIVRLNSLLMAHANCGDLNIDKYIQNQAERIVARPKSRQRDRHRGGRFTFAQHFSDEEPSPQPQSQGLDGSVDYHQYDAELPSFSESSTVMNTAPSPQPVPGFDNNNNNSHHQRRTDSLSSASASASASTSGYTVQTPNSQQGIATTNMVPLFHGNHRHRQQQQQQLGTFSSSSSFPQPFQGLPSPPPMQSQHFVRAQMYQRLATSSYNDSHGPMPPMPQQSLFTPANMVFNGHGHAHNIHSHSHGYGHGHGNGGIQVDHHRRSQQQHSHGLLLEDMLAPSGEQKAKGVNDEGYGKEGEHGDGDHDAAAAAAADGLDFDDMQMPLPGPDDPARPQLSFPDHSFGA